VNPVSTVFANIFREYDIRGLAETELTPEFVRVFGYACGKYFREHGLDKVILGRDNRLSSDRIFTDLSRGLAAAGCELVDLGTVTTPIFYFSRVHWDVDAGVMITASHNPGEFNGFKVAMGPGTIYGKEVQRLREICQQVEGEEINCLDDPKVERINPKGAYLKMLTEKIKLGPKHMKVAVDCGNGSASLFAEEVFGCLGCDVESIYCESDGSFPNHHPDPVKTANLKDLIALVRESDADIGLGFDGDGDRLGVVDNLGNVIWGDRFMVLYWREILAKHPGSDCIIEVKCSQALVEEAERLGGKPIFFKTGHSLIKAKMREIGALFTGEMSGHMFFADEYYGYDDAFYAAARLLRIISNTDKSLAELLADVPYYPSTAETHVPCKDTDKFAVVRELTERFRKLYPVIDVDGVRVLFPGGWGLARCSNTQPVIVARCEGTTEENLQEFCRIMKKELESFPQVGDFEWEQ
jgi:phosphomannomutase/phosphoglucomutase